MRRQLSGLETDKSRLDTLLTAERDALQRTQTQFTDAFKAIILREFLLEPRLATEFQTTVVGAFRRATSTPFR